MDCKRAHDTMQEALDQRLKTADQRGFQEHVLVCKPCRQDYEKLRRLRQWTRELPRETVARDFSARLFARIRAGEGSPEAIFAAPVPVLRQARVFFSGALTAAALLLGFWLLFDALGHDGGPQDGGALPESFARSAQAGLAPVVDPVPLAESAFDAAMADYKDLERFQAVQHPDQAILQRVQTQADRIGRRLQILTQLPVVPTDPSVDETIQQLLHMAELMQRSPLAFFQLNGPNAGSSQFPPGTVLVFRLHLDVPRSDDMPRFKPKPQLRPFEDRR